MTILLDNRTKVQVLDLYEVGERKLASVRALEGQPFIGGDKWPRPTEYSVVPAERLTGEPQAEQQPAQPNLLTLALAKAKQQWSAGESVWIWRNGNGGGAFLKEGPNGFVCLCLTGKSPSCVIFWLDPITFSWVVSKTAADDYQKWVKQVRR